MDSRASKRLTSIIIFTLRTLLVAFCSLALLFANVQGGISGSGQVIMNFRRTIAAAAADDGQNSLVGEIVEIPGIGPMQLTFVNGTGYQGRVFPNDKLEVDITINFKPHGKYVPTDQDVEDIQQSDFPMLNLQHERTFPDDRTMISKWNFITPVELTGSDSSSLTDAAFVVNQADHPTAPKITFVDDSGKNPGPVTGSPIPGKGVKKAVDTVEGVIMEIWKLQGTYSGTGAEFFHEVWKYSGWSFDFAVAGFEFQDMKDKIQTAKDCVKSQKFGSEDIRQITLQHIDDAGQDIMEAMLVKFFTSTVWKVVGNKTPSPWFPIAKLALSKYADSVVNPIIKMNIDYINKIANCSEFKVKAPVPTEAECLVLLKKNLKNFAQNGCLPAVGTPPPLKKFHE